MALCVADELYTCCGMDGLTDTMLCLAKVLASLPLPEDDQVLVHALLLGDGFDWIRYAVLWFAKIEAIA